MKNLIFVCIVMAAVRLPKSSQENQDDVKRILLNDDYYTIINKVDALTKQMESFTKKMENFTKQTEGVTIEIGNINRKFNTITKEVESLTKKLANVSRSTLQIAFVAKLTTSVSGIDHHIYFDDVALNLGNAYNPYHGTFVAPVSGTYEISLKACSAINHAVTLDIMVNTNVVERLLAGDPVWAVCSSTSLPVHLTTGDDVYVKQGPHGDYLYSNTRYGVPQFTAVLLKAD